MAPIPVLGSVAMVISLFAAFAFTSYLAMRIRPSMAQLEKAKQAEHASKEKLDRLFRRIVPKLLDSKSAGYGFLVGLVILFFTVIAMFYTTAVTVKMLPYDNKAEFAVVIDMPEGTVLPATSNIAREVGVKLTVAEMPPGPPVVQAVVAEIYGPDATIRRQVASDMTALFEATDGLADVDNYMSQPYEAWRFVIDTQKASTKGVSPSTVIESLSAAMGDYKITDVREGSALEPTWIVIEATLALRANPKALSDLPIPAPGGATLPLAELGSFERIQEDPIIYHKRPAPTGIRGR